MCYEIKLHLHSDMPPSDHASGAASIFSARGDRERADSLARTLPHRAVPTKIPSEKISAIADFIENRFRRCTMDSAATPDLPISVLIIRMDDGAGPGLLFSKSD